VLQAERYGEFTYTLGGFPAGSAQTVTLYFAEVFWTAAGQRSFNVAINGGTVLTAFDIFAAAGGVAKAISGTFAATANASGQIVIHFTRAGGPDNPKVNAVALTASGERRGQPAVDPDLLQHLPGVRGQVPRAPQRHRRRRHPGPDLGLHRRDQPVVAVQRRRHDRVRLDRPLPGRHGPGYRERHGGRRLDLQRRAEPALEPLTPRLRTAIAHTRTIEERP